MKIPFNPPPGINSDDTTFSNEGRWSDCNNVRFVLGKAEPIKSPTGGSGFDSFPDFSTGMFCHLNASGNPMLLIGMEDALWRSAFGASADTDVTPSGLPTGSSDGSGRRGWTFGPYGSSIICCPSYGTLYVQDGTTSDATVITNAPDKIIATLVTAQRQVMALGCNEETSGTWNPRCIRWSDIEDYTDWTTATNGNAGEHILDDSGWIVGGTMLGDYIAVWTNTSLFMGTFLGEPGQTFRFERIAGSTGLISLRGFAVDGMRAYWMAPDNSVMTWAPGDICRSIPCPISRSFTASKNNPGLNAFFHKKYREFWLFYAYDDFLPSASTVGDVDGYVAFNVDDLTWFKGDLKMTAAFDTAGLQTEGEEDGYVVATQIDGQIFYLDTSTTWSGDVLTDRWSITSADQYIDEGQRRVEINEVWPDFKDTSSFGTITMSIMTRDFPNSSTVTTNTYTLSHTSEYVSTFAAGRIASIKFEDGNAFARGRFGKLIFDVTPVGDR